MVNMARTPLLNLPLDLFYFVFFALHIPITLSMDLQLLKVPKEHIPTSVQEFHAWYAEYSADPILLGGFGQIGRPGEFAWCTAYLYLQTFGQLPVFFVGLWGLWKASPRINLLLLVYGATTVTTVLACLATISTLPTTSDLTAKTGITSLTEEQRAMLLQSYIPMGLVIPAIMTLDMGWRTLKLVEAGLRSVVKEEKSVQRS